jgi:hypothetical protein
LITASDHDRYEKIVHSSSKLLRSKVAEILSYVIAYGLAAAGFAALPHDRLMSWSYYAGNGARVLSLAGKWHALVSVPLLFVLVLGWIWRQFAWARFLYLVSRMKLQLISTHPDQCGGLIFLSTVIRAYRLIGFACASIVAGGILNRTIHGGARFLAYRDIMLGMPLFITLVCIAPLFVFAPILKELHAKAMFEYGKPRRSHRNPAPGEMAPLLRGHSSRCARGSGLFGDDRSVLRSGKRLPDCLLVVKFPHYTRVADFYGSTVHSGPLYRGAPQRGFRHYSEACDLVRRV